MGLDAPEHPGSFSGKVIPHEHRGDAVARKLNDRLGINRFLRGIRIQHKPLEGNFLVLTAASDP